MTGNEGTRRKRTQKRKKEDVERYWLTEPEVDSLVAAAASIGRHGARDSAMVLLAYRHGYRVCELVAVDWSDIDLVERTIYVRRRKGSKSTQQNLEKDEVRALRKLGPKSRGPVFTSENGGPLSTSGFFKIFARAGVAAKLGLPAHPHQLRHGFGYHLANLDPPLSELQIMHLMGHRNPAHTLRYTELNPQRLRKLSLWGKGATG